MPYLIITKRYGELANRLLQYSHLIGFAEEHGYKIINFPFNDYKKHFIHTKNDVIIQYPTYNQWYLKLFTKIINWVYAKIFWRFDVWIEKQTFNNKFIRVLNFDTWDDRPIAPQKLLAKKSLLTIVNGWFCQDPGNFKKHAQTIRNYFEPLEIYQKNINTLLNQVSNNVDEIICVHIRRPDLHLQSKSHLYFTFADSSYIELMKKFEAALPDKKIGFILISNHEVNLKLYQSYFKYIYTSTKHFIEDLYLMSACNYIISNAGSTYSKWASFYGKVPLWSIDIEQETFDIKSPTLWRDKSICPIYAHTF